MNCGKKTLTKKKKARIQLKPVEFEATPNA
jgi:hypothetical protein